MHAMNSVLVYYQRHQQNHFTAQNLHVFCGTNDLD